MRISRVWVLLSLSVFMVGLLQAQDETPTLEPTLTVTLEPSLTPSEVLTLTPEDTATLTVEPTLTPEDTATLAVIETPTEPIATLEVPATITDTPLSLPLFPLIFSTDFNTGIPLELKATGNWAIAETTREISVQPEPNASLRYDASTFTGLEIEAQVLLVAGRIRLIQSVGSQSYEFVLDSSGQVELRKDGIVLTTAVVSLPADYVTVRVSFDGTTLSATVNNVLVASVIEPSPLPARFAVISVDSDTLVRLDSLNIYGVPAESATATPTVTREPKATAPAATQPAPIVLMAPSGCPFVGMTFASANSDGFASSTGIGSTQTWISEDGRFVLYLSSANNLVIGDTDNALDLFRYDRQTCTTLLISTGASVTSTETLSSWSENISPDGNYVTFRANGDDQLFMRDVNAATTNLISRTTANNPVSGAEALGGVVSSAISWGGRVVAFYTQDKLSPADTDGTLDLYLRDTATNTTTLITSPTANDLNASDNADLFITSDGRFVLFNTFASYSANDTDATSDVYRYERATATLKLVSECPLAEPTCFDGTLLASGMSADGEQVLVAERTGIEFLSRLSIVTVSSNTITRVLTGVSDARRVRMAWNADVLVYDSGTPAQVYAYQISTNTTVLVSKNSSSTAGNDVSYLPVVSGNGRSAGFASSASNLVANDTVLCGNVNCTDAFAAPLPFTFGFTAPMGLWADNIAQNSTLLRWTNTHSGGTGIKIQQSVDGINWRTDSPSGMPNSSSVANPLCGSTFYFRVAAYNSATNTTSAYSNTITVTFLPCAAACGTLDQIIEVSRQSPTALLAGNVRNFEQQNVLTADGRYGWFITDQKIAATDTAPGDNRWDVYRFDRVTCEIVHVSLSDNETVNGGVIDAAIAPNNPNIMAFMTSQPMATNDTDVYYDVYVRDLSAGTTVLISQTAAGVKANHTHMQPGLSVSENGEWIAFGSDALNLTTLSHDNCLRQPAENCHHVYAKSRTSGELVVVSTANNGFLELSNGNSRVVSIVTIEGIPNVVYTAEASNLTPLSNLSPDILIRPIQSTARPVNLIANYQNSGVSSAITQVLYYNNQLALMLTTSANFDSSDQNNAPDAYLSIIPLANATLGVTDADVAGASYEFLSALPPIAYYRSVRSSYMSADLRYVTFFESDPYYYTLYIRDRSTYALEALHFDYLPHFFGMSADGRWIGIATGGELTSNSQDNFCETQQNDNDYNDPCVDVYLVFNPFEVAGRPTPTPTATNTNTPVSTPTITRTPSPTATLAISYTPSPSYTPSITPTPSRTPSPTMTHTPTATTTQSYLIPSVVTPLSPTDGAILTNGRLTWQPVLYAANYEIGIATDNTFTGMVSGYPKTTGSPHIMDFVVDGTYYWRVRAINDIGQAGPWNTPRSFVLNWLPTSQAPTISPTPTFTLTPTTTLSPMPSPTPGVNCPASTIQMVSRAATGTQGNAPIYSNLFPVSADGRFVVFTSREKIFDATNTYTDTFIDYYRFDRFTCEVRWISRDADVYRPGITFGSASISANGDKILFAAGSVSQVGSITQLFLHTVSTGTTTLVSRSSGGLLASAGAIGTLSADGNWVVSSTKALLTTSNGVGSSQDVYLTDLTTMQVTLLTSPVTNDTINTDTLMLSNDGRYSFFVSNVSYSVNDTDSLPDLYRYDRITRETLLASPCIEVCPNDSFMFTDVSGDGTKVLMAHYEPSLRYTRVYIYDINFIRYIQPPIGLEYIYEPRMSDNADIILFSASYGMPSPLYQVYAYRRSTNQLVVVSRSSGGMFGNSDSYYGAISGNGAYATFFSNATNLVVPDTNAQSDVFLAPINFSGVATPTPTIAPTWTISPTPSITPTASRTPTATFTPTLTPTPYSCATIGLTLADIQSNGIAGYTEAERPRISGDGRYVVFHTQSRLVGSDSDSYFDVYRYDRQTCTVVLVSNSTDISRDARVTREDSNVSDDGNLVLYEASAMSVDDNNQQLFLTDITGGTSRIVSLTSDNTVVIGAFEGILSGNGQYVVITSSTALTNQPSNGSYQIYLRGLVNETTIRITGSSATGTAKAVTPDGRYVLFVDGSPLSSNDTDPTPDFYRWDSISGEILLLSPCLPAFCDNISTNWASLSANGEQLLFATLASGSTPSSLMHYNLATNVYTKLPFVPSQWSNSRLSADGDTIVLGTYLPNSPTVYQAIAYRISTNQLVTLSKNDSGVLGDLSSGDVSISTDGLSAAFFSNATNLRSTIGACSGPSCGHIFVASLSFAGVATPTVTYTPSQIPTVTLTPTITLTFTPSATFTLTNTASPTLTPTNIPLPGVVALVAPANNATLSYASLLLDWNATTNSTSYQLQVDTSASFTTLNVDMVVAETQFTSDFITVDGKYYWRVRGVNGSTAPQYGAWSAVRSFVLDSTGITTPPTLISPTNVEVVTTARPTFKWGSVVGAARYQLKFSPIPNVGGIEFVIPNIVGTSYTLKPTEARLWQGDWQWQVLAVDAAGNTDAANTPGVYSNPSTFTVDLRMMPAKNAVISVSPTTTSATVLFSWSAALSAPGVPTSYEVVVDNAVDDIFSNGTVWTCTSSATSCSIATLPLGEYEWWLKLDAETIDQTHMGRRFTISPSAPAAPRVVAPANGVVYGPTMAEFYNTTFGWDAVAPIGTLGENRYEVQLNRSNTFALIPVSLGTYPGIGLTVPVDSTGTWYWRVRTINSVGLAGAWSAIRSITFDSTPPPVPTITAPAELASVSSLRPTMTWSPVAEAVEYVVMLDGYEVHRGTPTRYTFTSNLSQGDHYIVVLALDRVGNSSESEARNFTVSLALTPLAGAVLDTVVGGLQVNTTFTWVALPGGAPYTLEVSEYPFFEPGYLIYSGVFAVNRAVVALPYGSYYWRVLYTSGVAEPTVIRSFAIRAIPPTIPQPITITPDSNISAADLTSGVLSWTELVTPDGMSSPVYEVQFANNAAFTLNMVSSLTTGAFASLPGGLNDGTIYVRVRVIYNLGSAIEALSAWTTRTYKQDTIAPAKPVVSSPSVTSAVRPTITWNPVAGAVSYLFTINAEPEVNVMGTSYAVPITLAQGGHQLNIKAVDAGGNVSDPTEFAFEVFIGTAPAPFAQFITATDSRSMTFIWTNQPTVNHTVWIALNGSWENVTQCIPTPVSNTRCTINLPLGTHGWAVVPEGGAPSGMRIFYVTSAGSLLPPIPNRVTADNVISRSENSYEVELTWNDPVVPNGAQISAFMVEVSPSPAFPTSDTRKYDGITSVNVQQLELPDNEEGVRYWRVRTLFFGSALSGWSATQTLRYDTKPPVPPTITSPLPNSEVSSLRPTIIWGASPTATRYEVTVINNGATTTSGRIASTSYVVPYALQQGVSVVWVEAFDALGNASGPSLESYFVTHIGTSPAINALLQRSSAPAPIAFSWSALPGATSYTLEIDSDGNFSTIEYAQPSQTTLTRTVSLPYGTYLWRVQTDIYSNDIPQRALAVAPMSGLTSPTNLHIPYYTTAMNTAFAQGAYFLWDYPQITGFDPVGYTVQFATNATFTTNVSTVGPFIGVSPSVTIAPLTEGTLYWRVRSDYPYGYVSAWSAPFRTILDDTPPGTFAQQAPLNNQLLTTRTPLMRWSPSSGAVRYEITLAFAGYVYQSFTTTDTSFTIPAHSALANGVYMVTLTAFDRANNTAFTDYQVFQVSVP